MNQSVDSHLDVPAGATVYAEGDKGQAMFIVESGELMLVSQRNGATAQVLAELGPGECFGELALFEDVVRTHAAVARSACRLLEVRRDALAEVLGQNPAIGLKLIEVLARRNERVILQFVRGPAAAQAKPAASKPAANPRSAPPEARPVSPTTVEAPAPAAAPRVMETCVLRHAQGLAITLDPSMSEYLVGRPDPVAGINPEINLSGIDPTRSLSRRHAKLVRQGRLYFVREEAATVNGTFVNNVRVATGVDVPIKPGDKLRFGAVEVDFAAA